MKRLHIIVSLLLIATGNPTDAQQKYGPQLSQDNFTPFNREAVYDSGFVHIKEAKGDGVLWLNDFSFQRGVIELDIKSGNNAGIAFMRADDETYDAVYFRPFNFKNPERDSHSIQYISMPDYNWKVLRESSPGVYENKISPVPDSEYDWFHVKIDIDQASVKVYVNDSQKNTLEVKRLNQRSSGNVGFWVGNFSEGWFKDLVIVKE